MTVDLPFSLDRMEIEEAGYNSRKLAEAIHKQLQQDRGPIDVEGIALGLDILEIVRKPLDNFEGGLLTQPERTHGMILVNRKANANRQRFTIAHELLHFLNDKHVQTGDGFRCRKSDISLSALASRPGMTRHARQEMQANRFAVELLAPQKRFAPFLRQGPDLTAVLELSRDMQMSKEATARRLVELCSEPAAVAFQDNGVLRYWIANEGFPATALRKGQRLPALPDKPANRALTDIEAIDPGDWLRKPAGRELSCQTLFQSDGYAMTLLIADPVADDDEEDPGIEDTYERYNRWN